MRLLTRLLALGAAGAAAATAGEAQARPLADRIAAAGAAAAFEYPARPGVCGDGRTFIRVGPHSTVGEGWVNNGDTDTRPCAPGPVRVVVRRAGAEITDVRATVGPAAKDDATELGEVSAADAAAYLLDLAEQGSGRVADRAVLPAMLAADVDPSARLVAIARGKPGGRRGGRHEALFWAGRYASARLRGASSPFDESDDGCPNDDERRNAVFVMSQLRDGEAVPALIDVARRNKDACVRGAAVFWLVESGDDRAVDVVASLLGK